MTLVKHHTDKLRGHVDELVEADLIDEDQASEFRDRINNLRSDMEEAYE